MLLEFSLLSQNMGSKILPQLLLLVKTFARQRFVTRAESESRGGEVVEDTENVGEEVVEEGSEEDEVKNEASCHHYFSKASIQDSFQESPGSLSVDFERFYDPSSYSNADVFMRELLGSFDI
ncbi:hypothetical protein SADUNF_Sadunf03G0055700 [Salix dunnii]|uniref:Uncharacterized protein n=1 Tax=Salix dunnii TaxID=1413687 RepID=A0A835KA04_9ROSI|nr:hypothetical protein SADUNF_Sadunf03G0055700 [Salix dunnii]